MKVAELTSATCILRWGSCVLLGPCHSSSFFPVPLPKKIAKQRGGDGGTNDVQERNLRKALQFRTVTCQQLVHTHEMTYWWHPWLVWGLFVDHVLFDMKWFASSGRTERSLTAERLVNEHFADFWPFLPTYYPPEKYHIPFQRFGGICFRFLESGISTLSQTSRLIWNSRILKGISWVFLYFCCFQGHF